MDKQSRVSHIIDLMVSGRFVTGTTSRQLAKQWGVSESTVGDEAAEASRAIHREMNGRSLEELRSRLTATLEHTACRLAESDDPRCARVAIEAIKTLGTIMGAQAPQKVEATLTVADFFAAGFDSPEVSEAERSDPQGGLKK